MEGYYWVQMNYMSVWVIGLYKIFNNRGHWYLPGLPGGLEAGTFKYIADVPIPHPNEMHGECRIWVPDTLT
jgi:hypothetical protein